jgi:hypothetical protein
MPDGEGALQDGNFTAGVERFLQYNKKKDLAITAFS